MKQLIGPFRSAFLRLRQNWPAFVRRWLADTWRRTSEWHETMAQRHIEKAKAIRYAAQLIDPDHTLSGGEDEQA